MPSTNACRAAASHTSRGHLSHGNQGECCLLKDAVKTVRMEDDGSYWSLGPGDLVVLSSAFEGMLGHCSPFL